MSTFHEYMKNSSETNSHSDITDKAALSALVANIRQNFPPIAGIAHGAMVLDDTSFFEMPFEKMQKVLGPKVQGAIFLDELFQNDTLEFFVLFSSVTAIAGNRGQSAYTTANMFMSSLATQRRQRGLAASILHIGAVMGVGYINRGFSDAIFAALRKTGFMMMSEREFHLCFGEAVVASHPRSDRNPEIITALETIRSTEVQPPWAEFPRFQHCVQVEEAGDRKAKKKAATVSTKTRLLEATNAGEVFEIVSGECWNCSCLIGVMLTCDRRLFLKAAGLPTASGRDREIAGLGFGAR